MCCFIFSFNIMCIFMCCFISISTFMSWHYWIISGFNVIGGTILSTVSVVKSLHFSTLIYFLSSWLARSLFWSSVPIWPVVVPGDLLYGYTKTLMTNETFPQVLRIFLVLTTPLFYYLGMDCQIILCMNLMLMNIVFKSSMCFHNYCVSSTYL